MRPTQVVFVPEQTPSQVDDSFCIDCQKVLSDHDLCARDDVRPGGCGHYTCDCICDFIRDKWPDPDFQAPHHADA